MDAMTLRGFNGLVGDSFLTNLHRRTSIIHGISLRAKTLVMETQTTLALLGILNMIECTAEKVSNELHTENRGIFDTLVNSLSDAMITIRRNTSNTRDHWKNDNICEAAQSVSELEYASTLSKNLVVDTGNQIISGQMSGCDMSAIGIGDITINDIIRITMNLSDPRKVGRSYINVLTPVTLRQKHAEVIIKVLLNVLNNAYHAMSEKSYTDNAAPFVKIFTDMHQNLLSIEVEDNGIGMSPEMINSIFIDNGQKSSLRSCKKILEEQVHGTLSLKSILGEKTIARMEISLS